MREIARSLTPCLARDAMLCTDAAGMYRTYANQNGHTQVRTAEADDLPAAHPDARWPSGCTGAPRVRAL